MEREEFDTGARPSVVREASDELKGLRQENGTLYAPARQSAVSSLVGRLARLGCTRIGSPGILG